MGTSITKRIAKNFSWLLFGNATSSFFNFLVIVYIARILGASTFGTYKFVQAFLVYLVIVIDSGLSLLGTREIAREREKASKIVINLFIIRFLLALVEFFVSFVFIYFLPINFDLKLLFIVMFLIIFSRALNADWVFQGLEKMEYIAFARIIFSFFSFCFVILFVKTSANLVQVPLIQFVVGIITSIIFIILLFRRFASYKCEVFSKSTLWNYFLQAIPLGASVFLIQIYNNLDTIMLGFMDEATIVGYYNAAYQVFFILVGGFSIWQSTAIPVASKIINEGINKAESFLEKYFRLTMLVVIPLTFLTFLISPIIIKLIYGTSYMPAILALQILVWTLIVMAIGSTYGILILVPAGKYNQFLVAVAVGAVVNIVFNILLIPAYSFSGAAVATILAEASAAIIAIYYSRSVLKLHLLRNIFSPFVFSILGVIIYFCGFNASYALPYLLRVILSIGSFLLIYLIIVWYEKDFIFSFIHEIWRKA